MACFKSVWEYSESSSLKTNEAAARHAAVSAATSELGPDSSILNYFQFQFFCF